MKFSLLTITGALASANAATIRGDQSSRSLKKIALMRKFTDALNKKARPVTRRLDAQGDQEEEEEITAETVMTVGYCVSAKVYGYNGDNNGDNNANYSGNTATMSYISFSTGVGSEYSYDSAYGNQGEEYVTSLDTYLQVVGESYAVEKSSLYSQCAMMASYCEMSDDEIAEFSQMTDEEFQEYLEHLEQEQEEQQEQQNYKAASTSYSAYTAYMSSNAGNRRHLYTDMPALCAICDQNFDRYDNYQDAEKEEEEAYDEMKELFESKFCFENGSGSYTGMTCGNDGRSIELGQFNDEDCLYLSEYQNAYNMFQDDGDGEEDIYLYMTAVYDMANNPFSCQRGGVVQYDGGNEPSEACETLIEESISKTNCEAANYNNYDYNGDNQAEVPAGYDMNYSEDLDDTCSKIFTLEQQIKNGSSFNPFSSDSFGSLFKSSANGLTHGAIAGIFIGLFAVIAAAAFAINKSKKGKSDLEEPVFQGGALS